MVMTTIISFPVFSQKQNPKLNIQPIDGFFKTPVESNFVNPTGVAVNSKGHIHVLTLGSNNLMIFDANGNYIKSLAQGMLITPHGLRIDKDDNIWITDLDQHVVLKLDQDGHLLMVLGQRNTIGEFSEELQIGLFNRPADIAFASNGDIFIADGYGNSRVAKFDKNGKYIKAWGVKGTANGEFNNPHNIIIDNQDRIYVADRNNSRVQIFDKNGNHLNNWAHVGKPWGLAITKEQIIYLGEGTHGKVFKLDLDGNILGEYSNHGKEKGQVLGAHGMAVDNNGFLYITEVFNWRVEKFQIK